jgi:hypothetical protein
MLVPDGDRVIEIRWGSSPSRERRTMPALTGKIRM